MSEKTYPSNFGKGERSTPALVGTTQTDPAFPGHLAFISLCSLASHDCQLREINKRLGCHDDLIAIGNRNRCGSREDGRRQAFRELFDERFGCKDTSILKISERPLQPTHPRQGLKHSRNSSSQRKQPEVRSTRSRPLQEGVGK